MVELEHGDRVQVGRVQEIIMKGNNFYIFQVYVYTFTGLHDKGANHLTQFLGFLLRPAVPTIPQIED